MPNNLIEKLLLFTILQKHCDEFGYVGDSVGTIETIAKDRYRNDNRFHCQVDQQVANLMTIISPYVDQQK